jgi:transcriptional regulator with XRE-family HTH domain
MSHPVDEHVAQKIRQARVLRGMTQSALAGQIGCSFQQLQKYEAGQNRVSASRLFQIAKALEVEPAYFFDGIDGEDAQDKFDNTASRIMFALAKVENPDIKETLCRMVQAIADSDLATADLPQGQMATAS